MKTYTIKPLQWERGIAQTTFASYRIYKHQPQPWDEEKWRMQCVPLNEINEYEEEYSTYEEAKAAAEKDWTERMEEELEEVVIDHVEALGLTREVFIGCDPAVIGKDKSVVVVGRIGQGATADFIEAWGKAEKHFQHSHLVSEDIKLTPKAIDYNELLPTKLPKPHQNKNYQRHCQNRKKDRL